MSSTFNWDTGGRGAIGATPVAVADNASGLRPEVGVQIKADANNTVSVFIGKNGVTANSGDITDGYPLAASESILVPTRRPEEIYAIAGDGGSGQIVYYFII